MTSNRSSMVEQRTFNPLVLGSSPSGCIGYMAEWSKAAVCKTVWFPIRKFESCCAHLFPSQSLARAVQKRKIFLRRLLRNRPSAKSSAYGVLSLGDFGVISAEPGLLTRNQRESIRKVLARRLKPVGGRY